MFLFDIYFYWRWGYWERGMRKIISHSTQDLGGNPGWTRRQCLSFILWFQLSFVRFAEHSKSLALKEGGECNVMTGPCLVKFHLTGRWHMPVRLRKDLFASWKALHTVKHCPDEQFSGLDELASFICSKSCIKPSSPPDFAWDLPSMERQRCDRELIENSLLCHKIIGNASEFTT